MTSPVAVSLLRAGLLAVALLLTGCGAGTVQCGPCPPALHLSLLRDGAPRPLGVHARAEVCLEGGPCVTGAAGGSMLSPPLPAGTTPGALDGRAVTVTATSGLRVWTGSARLRFVDGGDAVCACSSTSADVELARVRVRP